MLIKPVKAFIFIFLSLWFMACHQNSPAPPSAVSQSKDSIPAESGDPDYIKATGTLIIPSDDIVLVTAPSAGIIKEVPSPSGSYVRKGDALAIIENIEFLKLQQQYLEAKSEFFYYGEDLKRQGGLAIENATSVKKMQQAQRDYQTSEIRYRSIEKQLALIGFNTDSLDADHLSSGIAVRSTVSGYIDKIMVHTGKQISAGETILVLVRKYEPVISLELPDEYYSKFKTGKPVEFFFPGDSLVIYKARLTYISKQADVTSHLIKAWATPLELSPVLIPGRQVCLRLPL